MSGWELAGELLRGPLWGAGPWPLALEALLCDLRPRFLVKAAVGPSTRAVARNGRVLLCADRPPADLAGTAARVRLQTWHRAILPGEAPRPYGVLLCVRPLPEAGSAMPAFTARLAPRSGPGGALDLDVGGGLVLAFDALPHPAGGGC
jgi:hypothetical protein